MLTTKFFNRVHAIAGSGLLTALFTLLGVTFAVLDWVQFSSIRSVATAFLVAAIGCATGAVILSGEFRAGWRPVVGGASMAALFLATCWILAKTGG